MDVNHQVSEIIISPVKHPRNISGTTENMDLHPRVLGEHRTLLLASQGTRISTAGFVENTDLLCWVSGEHGRQCSHYIIKSTH